MHQSCKQVEATYRAEVASLRKQFKEAEHNHKITLKRTEKKLEEVKKDKEWQKNKIQNLLDEFQAREKDLDNEKSSNAMYDEVVVGEQSKYAELKAEYVDLEYDHRSLVAELDTAHHNLRALERWGQTQEQQLKQQEQTIRHAQEAAELM